MLLCPSPPLIWDDHAGGQSGSLLCDDGPETHKSIAGYIDEARVYGCEHESNMLICNICIHKGRYCSLISTVVGINFNVLKGIMQLNSAFHYTCS